ncbi:MAG: protein kinase [Pirellulaceae bacterium]
MTDKSMDDSRRLDGSSSRRRAGLGSLSLDSAATVHPSASSDSNAVIASLGSSAGAVEPQTPALPDDRTVISTRPPVDDVPLPILSASQHIGQSLVGRRLEHYELIEFVGGGGMGAVFRATDSRLGRTVAVKVLSRDHTDEETIRRFRNEAQSAARLDHPNIARVHYVGEDHGWNFIVFEFIEGVNLRDLVEAKGPLSVEDALYFTLKVAEALAHSSSRDVVHRDIKPSNVLVATDSAVKLVDMGLARLHQVESSSDDLTASGVTLGTFDYISPEQARDPRSADVRSDIYSLGCTLYYMLAARPPFPDGTALQKLLRHSEDEPADLRQFRPDINPRVTNLLAKMLAKRRSQRHQTAGDLVAEIVALGEQLGLSNVVRASGVVVALPAPQPQFWARAAQIVVAIAVLTVAVIILDSYAPRSVSTANVSLQPKDLDPAPAIAPQDRQGKTSSPTRATMTSTFPAPGTATLPDDARAKADADAAGSTAAGSEPSPLPVAAASQAGAFPTNVAEEPVADASLSSEQVVLVRGASGGPLPAGTEPVAGSLGPPGLSVEIGIPAIDALASAALGPPSIGTPVLPVKIRRLVVTSQLPAQIPVETEYQTSLAAACRRAAELGLNEIELQWNGSLVESPLEITHSRLALRAAIGYQPVVRFQPQVSLSDNDRQMIRLAGGPTSRLTLHGVELALELPTTSASGWSLFSLSTGQTLELMQCVLTVRDGDGVRPPIHDQVGMIAVQPRRMTGGMTMEPQAAMSAGTTILIDNSIARGEATFIRLPEDIQLTLRWTQGLLVTPGRLLETTGSASSPKWFERISLSLDHVTAVCRQGIFQSKRRSGASDQFGLDVDANHCILMTDTDAPLYEFVGVGEVTESDLQCDGEFNGYPHADVTFLRIRPTAPGERTVSYGLEESSTWSNERRRSGVVWRQVPALDQPAHSQTKAAFELDSTFQSDAGFDSDLLPTPRPGSPLPMEASAATATSDPSP